MEQWLSSVCTTSRCSALTRLAYYKGGRDGSGELAFAVPIGKRKRRVLGKWCVTEAPQQIDALLEVRARR